MTAKPRLLVGEKRGRFPYSNSLLVETSHGLIVVDAGAGDQLLGLLETGKIHALIISHYHPDHIRLIGLAAKRVSKLYAPLFDTAYQHLEELGKRLAPPVWAEWTQMAREMGVPERLPEATPYEAWDEVEGITPLWLPGHLYTHHGFAIGDCVYGSDVDLTGFGPWYGNPEASLEQFIRDIVFIASLRPKRYCSSHTDRELVGEEVYRALADYAATAYRKAARLAELLASKGPLRPRDLAGKGVMYPRIPGHHRSLYLFFDEMLVAKTLSFLEGIGVVSRLPGARYTVKHNDFHEAIRAEMEKTVGLIESYA